MQCCKTIQNVEVNIVEIDGTPLTITIGNGCIERKSFLEGNQHRKVAVIDINGQSIPRLEKDSIKHLLQLRKLTIRNTDLKTLDLDIFRNTPVLETVDFISNKIEVIRDGVYNYQDFVNVSLYDNQIHSMDVWAFSNMDKLTNLNVSYNRLKSFEKSWFFKVPKLTTVDFQHNLIVKIPSRAFGNATSVKNIFLKHNNINTIQRKAFQDLRSLETLDLSHNLLKTIDVISFPRGIQIKMLYLNANRFNSLGRTLFHELSISVVCLDGNPWNCYCQRDMQKFLEQENVTVKPSFECNDVAIPICAVEFVTECEEEPNDALTEYFYRQMVQRKDSPCVRYME